MGTVILATYAVIVTLIAVFMLLLVMAMVHKGTKLSDENIVLLDMVTKLTNEINQYTMGIVAMRKVLDGSSDPTKPAVKQIMN